MTSKRYSPELLEKHLEGDRTKKSLTEEYNLGASTLD